METTFLHVSCYPVIVNRKFIYGFSKSTPTLRYTILDTRLPPCNAISEGRPLLSNTSSEAGALPLEVRIENDWDQIFFKSKFVHSFLETNFFHVSCYPVIVNRKYIYGFSKSASTPRHTILDSRLPPCNVISEGRPPLSNTSSEAGALPLEGRIENDSDQIFSKSKFVHCFLETTFLHVSCYPVIVNRKFIYGFSKSAPTPRYTILDTRLLPCNAISEGRPLLSNTSSEAGALPLEVRIENDWDQIFFKSKFVHSFLETNFLHVSCYPVIVNRKYIYGFSKSAPTPRHTILDSRLPPCNVISEGRPPLSNTSSEAGALPLEARIENDSDQIFSKSKFVHCFLETTFLHVSCYPVIVNRKFIYGFSKSAPTPRYTILDTRLPPCNAISEGRPLLSNTSSEAGALPLEVRIENDWDQILFKSKFVHSFTETNFLHVSCYPVIVKREYIYGFSKSAPTPRHTILDTRLPPGNAISEGRPLLSNTSSEAGALPLEVRIENDWDQIFFKSKFVHSFLETNFFHVSCYPVIVNRKYIYGFSKSAPTPRHTILDSRLPPCNVISEGRPPLSNTSSEAGALPLENDSDQIFSKSKFVHCFLETTFLHVSCYPVIVNRKFIYGFSKSAPTPRYTILDTRLPPCNAISEGRPLLSNTSSEAGALPLEVRIENDWDQIFFKSKFVHSFLETNFLHVSCYPVIVNRKYIYGFSKSAPTPRHTILDSRLPPCNVISEGRPPLSNTSSEAGALPLEARIENDSDQIFSKSKFVHCFLETTFLHVSCYPVIVNRKFIYGFSKSAPTPRYTILDTRLPPCNAISEGRPLLSNTSSEAGALPLEVRIENDWDQIFFKSKFVHSFTETNFLHVSCYPIIVKREYIYGFSKSAPTPRYTILDTRLPPCNAISEGMPLLSNTSSEAGALPLEVRIENDWDQIFFKSKFVHCFLETTFLHVSCYPVIVNRKFIYGFSKSAPTPRYTILDSRLPSCNVISEGRPPLSNTSSEAGALPLEGRIENDSDQIFSKSKFVHCFLETTFLHVSCYPVIVNRKFIYGFSKSAPTPRYTILDTRLPPCNAISEGRPLLSNTSSEAGALPLEVRIENDWDQIFFKSKFVHSFTETNFLHVSCYPVIVKREYIYGFSKSAPTPRHTILDSRLPPCNVISEGRPPLSNTSSEAGALPLEGRIENDSDQIFSKSKFVHCFLETTFLHVSCYPVIVNRKFIYGFSKSAPTPRYTILDSRLPPCNAISEGRPPLSNTSSEAGALPLEGRIENDSDQIFSKSKFVHCFLETTFSTFHVTLSL